MLAIVSGIRSGVACPGTILRVCPSRTLAVTGPVRDDHKTRPPAGAGGGSGDSKCPTDAPKSAADACVPKTPPDRCTPNFTSGASTPKSCADVCAPKPPANSCALKPPADSCAPKPSADSCAPKPPADSCAPKPPADSCALKPPVDSCAPKTPVDSCAPKPPVDSCKQKSCADLCPPKPPPDTRCTPPKPPKDVCPPRGPGPANPCVQKPVCVTPPSSLKPCHPCLPQALPEQICSGTSLAWKAPAAPCSPPSLPPCPPPISFGYRLCQLIGVTARAGLLFGLVVYSDQQGLWGSHEDTGRLYGRGARSLADAMHLPLAVPPGELPQVPVVHDLVYAIGRLWNMGVAVVFDGMLFIPRLFQQDPGEAATAPAGEQKK